MLIDFTGQTVLVTGAARGIGRGIVEGFAASGARVVATDVLAAPLEQMAGEVPGQVEPHVLDVTDAAAVEALVQRIQPVDVLVHVAGGVLGQSRKPLEEITDGDWDAIMDVNLRGAFHACRAVAPGMKQRRAGRIVIISSGAGLRPSLTGIHAYGTAKTAQIGLVRQISVELGPYDITVNAVAPGFLRTSPDYERQWASYGAEGQEAMLNRIPMRRLGEPADIASAVQFLASAQASWITGQVLPVNGGS
ncbi:SDR family oxidoreductase (plasmid) [Roseomonas marmotae]|uniref:SDR family oxidoreductase n=2 Tax=Roseomonas marmotae TaxID=2768161 RepID=A0ABS3KAT8_9PROT|nr:SDR family NAD(P)-dependent oxidoreductase [Roseomonas marmotae]MBO1074575.1 SDR family oxidoreductase [Roseomonas marmotae]QTI81747.1 SDR family oxidoreductase [Roseomonas marmotae]